MAIKDCLGRLDAAGVKVSDKQKASLQKEADRLENIYRTQAKYPEEDIKARAETDAINGLISDTVAKKKSAAIKANKIKEGLDNINNHRLGGTAALREMLVPIDNSTRTVSVDNLAAGIYGKATTELGDFVEKFRSKIPSGVDTFFRGHRDAVGDVVKALHGDKNVSPTARGFADAYAKARESILDRLEQSGVRINRLEDFGVSHKWDYHKVANISEDDFTKLVFPKLDHTRFFDEEGRAMSAQQIEEVVRRSYKNILDQEMRGTRGLLGGTANPAKKTHRVLHFKSGKDYLDVYNEIGSGELYDDMMESLQELATDAALAERFGPDPDAVFKELNRAAKKRTQKDPKSNRLKRVLESARSPENLLLNNEIIYNFLRGQTSGLGNPSLASTFSILRNIQTAAKLGSAAIAALGDQAFIKSTSNLWGVSYRKVLSRQLTDLLTSKRSKENRMLATRLGQIVDWSHGIASAANRFSDVNVSGTVSSLAAGAADLTIRSSGLAKMTRAAKHAFGLELNGLFAANKSKSFAELPDNIKNGFSVNAITEADWDNIRQATVTIDKVEWIDPSKMSDDVAVKYLAMVHNEVRQAIPEPGAEIRSMMTGGAAAGTATREVRSSFFQFGGFTLSVTLNNWRRLLFHPSNQGILNKVKFSANMMLYGTLMGGLALQLKDVKDGKDFRDPTDPNFVAEALVQAGTFGVGPLIPSNTDDIPESEISAYYQWAPPVVRMLMQGSTAISDISDLDPSKPTQDFLTKNIPIDQWYTDLLKQRLIIDQLKKMSDPNSGKSFRRQQKRLRKRTGQQYWWQPGATKPSRPPEITE